MFNCTTISYRATALQWNGLNFDDIEELLSSSSEVDRYGDDCIMVRTDEGISTLRIGDWVVRRENDEVVTYKKDRFATKYRMD